MSKRNIKMVKYHMFYFSFLVFPAMFSMLKYGIYKNTPISIRWLIKNHISFWGCSTRSHFFQIKLYILAKSLPFDTVLPRFFPEKSTNLAGVCYFIYVQEFEDISMEDSRNLSRVWNITIVFLYITFTCYL